jgi:protocatechuate 3,4-dioxygenase beta subunit
VTDPIFSLGRRSFMGAAAFGGAAFFARGVFAEELDLVRTPSQEEGPFYPDELPLDTDNDLLLVNDDITPAVGEITHLSGRILDARGNPLRNATVEVWEADSKGVYLHSKDPRAKDRDKNFQGFGRFLTGSTGEYYFRTIKPVMYGPRTAPHIHFRVKKADKELLTTQMYIKGFPGNERDFVFKRLPDEKARRAVAVDFVPIQGSRIGELAARFDIVLGVTPNET